MNNDHNPFKIKLDHCVPATSEQMQRAGLAMTPEQARQNHTEFMGGDPDNEEAA